MNLVIVHYKEISHELGQLEWFKTRISLQFITKEGVKVKWFKSRTVQY